LRCECEISANPGLTNFDESSFWANERPVSWASRDRVVGAVRPAAQPRPGEIAENFHPPLHFPLKKFCDVNWLPFLANALTTFATS